LEGGPESAKAFADGIREVAGAREQELRVLESTGEISQQGALAKQGQIDAMNRLARETEGYISTAEGALSTAQMEAQVRSDLGILAEENAQREEEAARATEARTAAMDTQITTIGQLIQANSDLNGEVRGVAESESGLYAAYDRATESIKSNQDALAQNVDSLDLTTEAGRNAQDGLFQIADAGLRLATSMDEAGASTDEVADSMSASRDMFLEAATSAGLTEEAAKDLADSLGLVEGERYVEFLANT